MKMLWMRSKANCPSEITLSQPKEQAQDKLQHIARTSTKYPFYLSIDHITKVLKKLDSDLLHPDLFQLLATQPTTLNEFMATIESFSHCPQFFNEKLENLIFQQHQPYYIKTLILTLDFYMAIETFVLYLYWRLVKFEETKILQEVLHELISIKYVCLNQDPYLEALIYFFFDSKLVIPRLKSYMTIQTLTGQFDQKLNIFDINPREVSKALTQINEEFYAQLKFSNLLTRIDKPGETEFMQEYFSRVNSFALYIQLCILQEPPKQRSQAVKYFFELSLDLASNFDLEGVFLIYHLALERVDQEYLQQVQYISQKQQNYLNQLVKEGSCDYRKVYTQDKQEKMLYPIPSFFQFWTRYKRIESNLKITKSLQELEPLREILTDLMFIRKVNYARWKNQREQVNSSIKWFLLQGHQRELSEELAISVGNWGQMQVALMRMATKR